jgi:hypothetical protein
LVPTWGRLHDVRGAARERAATRVVAGESRSFAPRELNRGSGTGEDTPSGREVKHEVTVLSGWPDTPTRVAVHGRNEGNPCAAA